MYDDLGVLIPKGRIVRAYEWFLELPVAVVLVVLWLAGVGLVGFCVLALVAGGGRGMNSRGRSYTATRRSPSPREAVQSIPATTMNA